MNRRDFIKVFSAGTTLAAATSLAGIADAAPVINSLEAKIILPGDDESDIDWVFDYVGYFSHQYEMVNEYKVGVDVPGNFREILNSIDGSALRFSFNLQGDYSFRYAGMMMAPDFLPKHVETFLNTHIFEARKSDLEIGEEMGDYDDSMTRSPVISRLVVVEKTTD